MKLIAHLVALFLPFAPLSADEKPFIIGELDCELGNNMFQVASASALAWDKEAEVFFPELLEPKREEYLKHIFFRCSPITPEQAIEFQWKCPSELNFVHTQIPYQPNMLLKSGAFQSEKYFAHHRQRILELFAPSTEDLDYIRSKYGVILDHPYTVGVQMRWFGRAIDTLWHKYLVQYGKDYFTQAVAKFPPNALFIISSNDKTFVNECFPKGLSNVVVLENEPDTIEFRILSLCQHQIISNSTFGWWAAWLNQNPQKIVVAPWEWIDPAWHRLTPVKDVYPKTWIRIPAEWTKPYTR